MTALAEPHPVTSGASAESGTTRPLITQDPIQIPDLIADACSKLDRNLTPDEWKTYLGNLPYRKTCPQLNPAIAPKSH